MSEIKFFMEYLECIGRVNESLGELKSMIRHLPEDIEKRLNSQEHAKELSEAAKRKLAAIYLSDLRYFIRN